MERKIKTKLRKSIYLSLLLVALMSCGGGGGGSSATPTNTNTGGSSGNIGGNNTGNTGNTGSNTGNTGNTGGTNTGGINTGNSGINLGSDEANKQCKEWGSLDPIHCDPNYYIRKESINTGQIYNTTGLYISRFTSWNEYRDYTGRSGKYFVSYTIPWNDSTVSYNKNNPNKIPSTNSLRGDGVKIGHNLRNIETMSSYVPNASYNYSNNNTDINVLKLIVNSSVSGTRILTNDDKNWYINMVNNGKLHIFAPPLAYVTRGSSTAGGSFYRTPVVPEYSLVMENPQLEKGFLNPIALSATLAIEGRYATSSYGSSKLIISPYERYNSPTGYYDLTIYADPGNTDWSNIRRVDRTQYLEDKGYGEVVSSDRRGYTYAYDPITGKYLEEDYIDKITNFSVSVFSDIYDSSTKTTSVGTINAAQILTAGAAMVKQKYPWMDGSLIRQTILSTATDIGDVGVDRYYGWGLLNVEKALNGPALFDKRLTLGEEQVVVNIPTGMTSTFSNNISGDAGLKKEGAGTLQLTGNTTYTGSTDLVGGTLIVRGTTYNSPRTNIRTLSRLIVKSPLSQKVSLKTIENDGGTFENQGNIEINGDYISTSNSTYVSGVNSTALITGKTELNGTLEITNKVEDEQVYITSKGVNNNVISSNNVVSGGFEKVQTEELLNANINNDGNTVSATISRKNVEDYATEIGADEMQQNVAQNLETAFAKLDKKIENNTDEEVANFKNQAAKLQALVSSNRAAVLDSLSGQIYASAQALTFEQSQTVNKDLTNRLTMLGTLDNVGDKFGLWTTAIGSNGKLKKDGYGTGKTNTYGGQVGVDKKFGDNLILGTALSYSKANVKFDRYGGESDATNLGLSLYGRLGNKQSPLYLQGRLGVGFVDSDVERNIMLNSTDISRAKINHKDKVLSAYVETGYDIKNANDDFVITPFVGLSHDSVKRGSFSEENSQFGLTADSKTYNQTAGLVGLRVGKSMNFGGAKTTLQGYITHQRAFNEEDLSFRASYTGLNGADFTVKGIGLSKNTTWAGIGLLNEITPNFAWYVNYDGKIDKSKTNNNVFTTGFRFNFD